MGQKSIGEYDTIRNLLEHLYTYGMYSREEFSGIGIGKNNYDKLLQILYQVFPQEDWSAHQESGRKILRFSHEPFENDIDRLAASFSLHTVSDSLLTHMALLLSKFSRETCLRAGEVNRAYEEWQPIPEDGRDRSATLRRQRKNLCAFGYLTDGTAGKGSFALRTLPAWGEEELKRLYCYADFCAGASALRMAPILLRNTVERALKSRGIDVPEQAFLFRGNVCRNIFDEEMVYTLLDACAGACRVELELDGAKEVVEPAYLRFDVRSGRWYLFALSENGPTIRRLSRIQKVRLLHDATFEPAAVRESVAKRFEHCNISSGQHQEEPVCVEVELHFEKAPWQRRQFQREMLLGRIIQRDGVEIYQALVHDPVELVPFLRGFGGYIRILPGEHDLAERCEKSWAAMLRALEGEA